MRVQPTPEKWGKDRTKNGEVVLGRQKKALPAIAAALGVGHEPVRSDGEATAKCLRSDGEGWRRMEK